MSGQSFVELLSWHPRDVATLVDQYERARQAEDERAREERFAAGTAAVFERMRGPR